MTVGIVLDESMSGWLSIFSNRQNGVPVRELFSISIRAYQGRYLKMFAPREFHGEANLGGRLSPISGHLTLKVSGPEYRINLHDSDYGNLFILGKKEYKVKNFKRSLVTCTLMVYKEGQVIGEGEIRYQEPIWKFLLTGVKFVRKEKAFEPYYVE